MVSQFQAVPLWEHIQLYPLENWDAVLEWKASIPKCPRYHGNSPSLKGAETKFWKSPASFKREGAENSPGHKVQADGDGHWQTLGWPCTPPQGYKYPPCSLHSCLHSLYSRSSPQGWRLSLHKPAASRLPSAVSRDQHSYSHGPFSGPPFVSQEGGQTIFIF